MTTTLIIQKPESHLGIVKAKGLKRDTLSGYWTERSSNDIVVVLMQQNLFSISRNQ